MGLTVHAQWEYKVYLKNGESYVGEIMAISDSYLLVKSYPNVVSIERSKVLYVLSSEKEIIKPSSPKAHPKAPKEKAMITALPLTKKWLGEAEMGLTFANPFAIRMGYKEWCRLNDRWQLGLGTSLQFFRYSMMNLNASGRMFMGKKLYFKSFLEGEFGLSYFEHITQIGLNMSEFFQPYPFDFSLVKQGSLGAGLWLDTSMGVALTTKLSISTTWYTLEENFNSSYSVKGDYFFGTALWTVSFVF
ncbi:MAG: hypothetical protein R2813_01480 [Flavobacteriales bacterium]